MPEIAQVVGLALLDVREAQPATHGEERALFLHRLRVMGYEVVRAEPSGSSAQGVGE